MDDSGPTASIIFFVLLLIVDAFFYGFGAAIRSLNHKEIQTRAEEENDRKSQRLDKFIDEPAVYINTVQLVVTFSNLIVGAFMLRNCQLAIFRLLEGLLCERMDFSGIPESVISLTAIILTFFVLMYIILTFGVLLPKRIAARMSEKWAYACINPVYTVTRILLPLTGLVAVTTKGILFLLGVRHHEDENDVTEEEIINMVHEGHEQGVIQASEAELISNIFEYGDKEAQDIMTHRKHIIGIEASTLLQDAISFMLEEKNSRYPVYEENIDHIIGILHLKDALRFRAKHSDQNVPLSELEGLLREPSFVPQTKNIDELFKEMQSNKMQMVIVVDEYGQTDGLLAMEDILEEIVGNIMDEYDEEQEYIEDKGNDEYIMEGKTPLEEVEELFDISFEEEEFETLNGFLISRLDKIPEPDEQFNVDYQGYNFKILSVENKMIQSVLVTKLPPVEEEESVLAEKKK
ncbi:MAG: HlyC/CorC family transporter [Lachnospiraceae bacterium]|nr:HlyC/CorC family transporter [Lachnospiraceae bacterium]